MSIKAAKSNRFMKNKYVEYRRRYMEVRNFSKHLEKADKTEKSEKADPSDSPKKAEPSDKTAPQKQEPLFPNAGTETVQNTESLPIKIRELNMADRTRMQQKLEPFKHHIKAAAARYGIGEDLIAGIIWQESRGNPRAVSHCGAMGLMQLMPGTAKNLGVNNAFNVGQNIDGGAKYIRQMIDKFGRVDYAVAAYNAGPGNVQKYGGIPPFRETQDYVPKVLGGAHSFRVAGGFRDTLPPTAIRA